MSHKELGIAKNILVIDDDADILDVVQEILSMKGYLVQTGLSGASIQNMHNDLPDLILLDILLQGENGRDLCRELKRQEISRHIPVILFSAHDATGSILNDCGADDFLAKPFRLEELLTKVALWLNPA